MCAMTTILFLGGWLPLSRVAALHSGFRVWYGSCCKICFLFFMFAMVKAMVPRYRYDQLMRLGWKVFLPIRSHGVVVAAVSVSFGSKRIERR